MSEKLIVDTRVTVETPEGVDFQFMIAGPGKRGMSFLIDTILKLGVVVVCLLLVTTLAGISGEIPGIGAGIVLVTWFAMSWMYGSCFEAFWNGQTPGKKSQNLRVVRTNGTPIGWFEAFGRNLLLVADGMLVLGPLALNTVGLLSMAATRRMQRLGDLVFDTMVIDETREFISRTAGITYGVDRLRRSECNGRFHVPERTLAVIERLFEGDRLISDGRREEIARTLSRALRVRLDFQEPGPDPRNPNTYFVQTPLKHTTFLKRVLKTFSDDPDGRATESEEDIEDLAIDIIDETTADMARPDSPPENQLGELTAGAPDLTNSMPGVTQQDSGPLDGRPS
ncbi:MAG TPA: RDD family protein [Planctomycetes bacterium]|nr:RDD family protein [Fuerstiella sp.]HIK93577.1 RDD family protein [Planctomycetota bacterium]